MKNIIALLTKILKTVKGRKDFKRIIPSGLKESSNFCFFTDIVNDGRDLSKEQRKLFLKHYWKTEKHRAYAHSMGRSI